MNGRRAVWPVARLERKKYPDSLLGGIRRAAYQSRPLLGFPRKSADAVFRLGGCDAVGWRGAAPETMERAEAGAAEAAFTAPETYGLRRILLWKNT